MSQLEKQNGLKEPGEKRPKKMVIGLSVATMLLVGGGVGTGIYLTSQDDNQPASKSETKIKKASEDKAQKTALNKKSKSSDGNNKQEEDILGMVLGKQETENSQVSAILDGPTQTSKEKTMNARTVALAAISNLPVEVQTMVNKNNDLGNTIPDLQVEENPLTPLLPNDNGVPEEEVPVPPTPGEEIPIPDPIPDPVPIDVDPTPIPANTEPQLVAENQSISIGTSFNPYRYVSASDAEDGDLTGEVEVIYNNVNPDREGTYQVTYKVTDSQNSSSTYSISVSVVNEAPVIYAEDVRISVNEPFNPMSAVSASDKEDGNLTDRIVVLGNEVNTEVAGNYSVSYQVTDLYGKSAIRTIQVQVVNDMPTIVANDQELFVGDDFQPLEDVSASDKQDGDLTSSVQVQANDVDTTQAGTYHVTYVVEDSAGGKIEKTVTIQVKEKNTAPEISMETNTINLHVGDQPDWTIGVTANDQEDGNLTDALTVDAADVDLTMPGTYKVVYQVTDSGGMTTTKEVTVTVE